MLVILALIILFHLATAILLFVATIHNVSPHHVYVKYTVTQHGIWRVLLFFFPHDPPWQRRGGWGQTEVRSSTLICGTPVTRPATLWRTATRLQQVSRSKLLSQHKCELYLYINLRSSLSISLSADSSGHYHPSHHFMLCQLLRLHPAALQHQTGREIHFHSCYPAVGLYVKHTFTL